MPLQGSLTTGDRYSITVDADPATPGATAIAIVWVPRPGDPPIPPVVDSVAPGMRARHAGTVPASQMLLIDFDLPKDPKSKIEVDVSANEASVAAGSVDADTQWSFQVAP